MRRESVKRKRDVCEEMKNVKGKTDVLM